MDIPWVKIARSSIFQVITDFDIQKFFKILSPCTWYEHIIRDIAIVLKIPRRILVTGIPEYANPLAGPMTYIMTENKDWPISK